MGNLEKLNKIEAIALILIIITNQIILNLPNSILTSTGSAAPLNALYISIIAIILTFIVCKLFKKFSNHDILDISHFLGGNILKSIVGFLYIVFFVFITSILLRYFAETLKSIYFNDAPIILLIIAFLLPSVLINRLGLNALSKITLFFTPVLLVSMLFLALSIFQNFDVSEIFPVLGYGINETFFSGLSNIFAFGGLAYLYFLKPLLKETKDFKKISIISITISAIFLVAAVACLLMVFPFTVSTDETLSIYLLSKTVELGRFIQRIDAVFIFFWIFATLCFVSINMFYILNIMKKITKIYNMKELSYSFAAIIFSVALCVNSIAQVKFLEQVVYKYFTLILVFGLSIIILVFANIKYKKKSHLVHHNNKYERII